MKRYIIIIAVLFYFKPVCSVAQEVNNHAGDSVLTSENFFFRADTLRADSLLLETIQPVSEKFLPNPKKATIYAAIFPGLGQIYNRKYWKLPLVYGSFVGCAYAINWNGGQYNGYKNAYKDFIDENPSTNTWENYRYGSYLKQDPKDWSAEMSRNFANTLKTARDYHRQNRDLSYIVTVGFYAIWIIDAYVDAQLFDFDVSPDLSMRVAPVLFDRTAHNARSIGMQLSFAF